MREGGCVYVCICGRSIWELTFFFLYIRYILHRMEGEGDEVCPEALARGGVYIICPICIEKMREKETYLSLCCVNHICKDCAVNH